MTKYKALTDFKDLQDNGKIYKKDDPFPSPANKKVSDARIKELSSTKNKRKQRLIVEVVAEKKEKKAKEQD